MQKSLFRNKLQAYSKFSKTAFADHLRVIASEFQMVYRF